MLKVLGACPVEFPLSLTARHTRATHANALRTLRHLGACPVEFGTPRRGHLEFPLN